jgi:serine/threonine protein kinase
MNYNIIKELGQGGMATVYLAEHKVMQKPVAVKILDKKFTFDEHIRKRFLAEARTLFTLSHPNIIKVTDLIDDGDTVAFVMEHVDGETLKEYLDRKVKLTDEEIKNIFSQMLDAVGYVHEQGLVHRDIKPSNFMIDKKGKVKLLDFGIAKNTDASSAEYTQTVTGMQMGTPMYMSPEQITETKSVTALSDIYSLGVVLWQLVTGEKPYNTNTLSTFQLQLKIVNELLALTGSSFDTVIKKATEKEVANRYASAAAFLSALQSRQEHSEKTVVSTVEEKTVITNQEKTVFVDPSAAQMEIQVHHSEQLFVGSTPIAENISVSQPTTYINEFDMEFILVEAGTFLMGASNSDVDAVRDEFPVHKVTISQNFYIGKFPVTQAQWVKIMGNNPSFFKNRPNCPVESVSWNNCELFIKELNGRTGKTYRLPTEAEWEFAARGGNKSKGFKYAGGNAPQPLSWNNYNSANKTQPIGQKQANELGLHDMSGNVWEWCTDWYGRYDSRSKTNPGGPSSGTNRVFRGGGWGSQFLDCRVTTRRSAGPGIKGNRYGLRLVLIP